MGHSNSRLKRSVLYLISYMQFDLYINVSNEYFSPSFLIRLFISYLLFRVQVLDDLEVTDLPKASENHIKENFSIDGNMTPKSNSKKATAFTKKRSFKDEILRGVFSEDYEKEKKRIMDPEGKTIKTWNKIFSLSCLFALFLDPLFLLLPVIDGQGCVANGMTAQVVLTILRSVTDVLYLIQIIVRFHTAYVAPSSRVVGRGELVIDPSKIAMRYLRKGFIIDLMASLPLTQVFYATKTLCIIAS